jgi:hypothetical protein
MHDLLKPALGGLELLLAMRLERLAALVERDGIFEIDFALFETFSASSKLSWSTGTASDLGLVDMSDW